jgi:branched-chain amino acid transport system substrate-binding protein
VDGLRPYLESQGFEIVMDEGYASDTTDFGSVINKLVESGATVLLGGGHYPDGSTFARQLYERKVGLKFVSLLVAPADLSS